MRTITKGKPSERNPVMFFLDEAAHLVRSLGSGSPTVDHARQMVSVPAAGSAETVIEAARRLQEAGVDIAEIALRRPSLDDVFLSLTGHTTTEPAEPEPAGSVPRQEVAG